MTSKSLTLTALTLALASPVFAQGRNRGGPGRDLKRDQRSQGRLKEGQKAPDFELALLDKEGKPGKKVKLSSFKGDRPVVLFFGSYT